MVTVSWLNQNGYLSIILIPLTLALYTFIPSSRPVLFKHMVVVGLVSLIEVCYFFNGYKNKHNSLWKKGLQPAIYIFSVFAHAILFVVLINFPQYWNFNKFSLILLAIVNLVVIFLPWWPYFMSKTNLLILYNVFYLTIIGIGSIIYK